VIDIRFYQAAVVVIPALLIAAALGSSVLGAGTRRPGAGPSRPGSGWGIAGAIIAACFVMVAELLALVSVAAAQTSVWTFVVVLAAITFLCTVLAVMAVHRLVEPLRGTWLQGVEWLVIVTTSVFAAAAISLAFLEL
jgi:hypothetical protein